MTVVEPKLFSVPGKLWPLSVEAYHALGEVGLIPEKTELLYGAVYHKMPKSPLHTFILDALLEMLRAVLPAGYLLRSEQPITTIDSEPEPDVYIARGERADFVRGHPRSADLVVEVCVTSHDYDRSKLRAYAKSAVKEVWLVLGPEREVEIYRNPSGEVYNFREVRKNGALVCAALPNVSVQIEGLFPAADLK